MPAPHHPLGPPAKPASGSSSAARSSTSPPPRRSSAPGPARPSACPVEPWARACGLDRDPGSDTATIPLLGPGPGFSRACAMTTDLSQPLIIATLPVTGDEPAALLIDGTHRLFKGHATGAAELPAYVLTEAETLAIRALR